MRVLVTGGTGMVGKRLVGRLLERADVPVVLTRRGGAARSMFGPRVEVVEGDPVQPGAWTASVEGCDAVVNLAGENLFGRRWNAEFKQRLVDSRVKTTENVAQAILRRPVGPNGQKKVLVNGSAIGIYGPHGDEELAEDSPPHDDFLGRLCLDWEQAARAVESAGVRSVQVRTGIVLDREGGALAQLLTPFKLFVGGPVGSGRQVMSWIHHADLVGLLLLALDNAGCHGPMNGTAPNPVTNAEFSRALGKVLHRPAFMPTPGFALRLLLGESADIVVNGQRVRPAKALALGYAFQYPTIDAALAEIFR